MRDRYLFSADRKVSEYRDVLEVTRGHARLITPSAAARTLRWILSVAYYVFYTVLVGLAVLATAIGVGSGGTLDLPLEIVLMVLWFAGLVAVGWAVDRRSLPLLAENAAQEAEIILEGARSFGTFQEVRARTMRGGEMKLIVDTRAPRFWEAMELLQGQPTASG